MFSMHKKTEDAKLKPVCQEEYLYSPMFGNSERKECVFYSISALLFSGLLNASILCPTSCVGVVPSFSCLQTDYKAITSFFFTCQCHSRYLVFPYKIYVQVSSF